MVDTIDAGDGGSSPQDRYWGRCGVFASRFFCPSYFVTSAFERAFALFKATGGYKEEKEFRDVLRNLLSQCAF